MLWQKKKSERTRFILFYFQKILLERNTLMFGCIGRTIVTNSARFNNRKQRQSISYVSDYLVSHPIETVLAVSTSIIVAVPLIFRNRSLTQSLEHMERNMIFQNRSLVQSFEDMEQKYRDVQTSERQLKDEKNQLRDILIRGRFGETILQQVLEEAKGDRFIKDFHTSKRKP